MVHVCEIEFWVLPVSDVINIRKESLSLNTASPMTSCANCVKNVMQLFDLQCQEFSLVKFSFPCIIIN